LPPAILLKAVACVMAFSFIRRGSPVPRRGNPHREVHDPLPVGAERCSVLDICQAIPIEGTLPVGAEQSERHRTRRLLVLLPPVLSNETGILSGVEFEEDMPYTQFINLH